LVLRSGGEGRERKGREEEQKGRKGAEITKRGGKESWNRAADWLRPALPSCHAMSLPCLPPMLMMLLC